MESKTQAKSSGAKTTSSSKQVPGKSRSVPADLLRSAVAAAVMRADKNGDGMIDLDEFLHAFHAAGDAKDPRKAIKATVLGLAAFDDGGEGPGMVAITARKQNSEGRTWEVMPR